ncbi:MAG: hypothetical protein HQK50_16265 [Oligoflexia bacterium]|nr:hypothetical protein [Oligoflexia bacterium]MBF0367131.1 hypothetical protein [Oligoflexia bacterium]
MKVVKRMAVKRIKTVPFLLMLIFVWAIAPLGMAAEEEQQEHADCPTVDLTAKGSLLEQAKIINQRQEGICYSVVAAEMIDAYRRSKDLASLPIRTTSPMVLAVDNQLYLVKKAKESSEAQEAKSRKIQCTQEIECLSKELAEKQQTKIRAEALQASVASMMTEELKNSDPNLYIEYATLLFDFLKSARLTQQKIAEIESIINLKQQVVTMTGEIYSNLTRPKSDLLKGGLIEDGINAAKKQGICLEQEQSRGEQASTLENTTALFKQVHNMAFSLDEYKDNRRKQESLLYGALSMACEERGLGMSGLDRIHVLNTNIEKILNHPGIQQQEEKFIHSMLKSISQMCGVKDRVKGEQLQLPEVKTTRIDSEDDLRKLLANHFNGKNKNNLPFGLGICGDLLQQGASYRGKEETPASLCKNKDGHAVLVVGSRWDQSSGKCLLQIQNSWGEGCDQYAKEFACDKGRLWIDSESLSRNSRTATAFAIDP